MGSKKNASDKNPKSGTPGKTTGRAKQQKVLSEAELQARLLQVLEKQEERGFTCGELSKKCGLDWRRGLAVKLGAKKPEAGSQDVQSFVYDLWRRGLVFSEPPGKGKRSCRFWSMIGARAHFPLAFPSSAAQMSEPNALSVDRLKSAYDKFVPQHLGGFVPIYKVRRELEAFKEEFDTLLRNLNERDEPVLELLGGDPQKFTDDQKNDSFRRGDHLFLRMRWRET
ncbi:hypothetical protein [Desulfomonile tiedjei]|uniref:Uncharacterized protein n=1 Tax=Desulfomonile tiedjei (strain ATCC 49306 / DSM 6799 / DCB-1) TaxID=706587 RepID=I4C4N7_DESTA|nr:hypothetical protein [Desulfomonile tiedjei]AFM24528.1 hypothetical protein Desti_1820 [Desulfomonile tiedjei DSM 6799]